MTFRALAIVCAVLVWASPSPCRAQSADSPAARSVDKANAGEALFQAGKWEQALRHFREAESLYHSPAFVLYAAKCLKSSGRWLDARRELASLLAEQIPPTAPDAWRNAQTEGRAELDSLERDIPTVIIEVAGGSRETRLMLDDHPVASNQLVPLDPGPHRFDAVDGTRRVSRAVTLRTGQKSLRILLRLPAPVPPQMKKKHAAPARGPNLPGLVLTGAGGAAILAGGIVGIVALNKASDARAGFPEGCDGSTCPSSRKPEIESRTESARRLASVSDGLFIGGGLVLAAGIVLLIVDPGAKPELSADAATPGVRF